MTPQAKEAITVVEARRDELAAAATTEQVRTKIANLHEVCRVLVVEAAQRPTIPVVIRHYKGDYVSCKLAEVR